MIPTPFVIPVVVGLFLIAVAFGLFRRNHVPARYFGMSCLVAGVLVVSPLGYLVLSAVRSYFGVAFTFVLGFGITIVALFGFVVYLLLLVGRLRYELTTVWQEVALAETERDE